MHTAPAEEAAVGMLHYVTDTPGVGGRIKAMPEDFVVTEREAFSAEPVDADAAAYPHLVIRVTLVDTETNAFATQLAAALGISRERVSWAGTKDKRAVTTQLMTVADVGAAAVGAVSLPGADIEIIGRAGRAIRFGDLAGNSFEVTIRDVDDPAVAADTTAALRAFGGGTVAVPNYFGLQRFGSHRRITHRVGEAILERDWAEALRRYVCDTAPTEPTATKRARADAATAIDAGDYRGALQALPERLNYERTLVHARIDGAPPRAAFDHLPSSLRQLFVHAVQSVLFNRIVSRRREESLPLVEPAAGDVVCFADADREYGFPVPDPDRTQFVTDSRLETVKRHCSRHRAFVTGPLIGTDTTFADGHPGTIERQVLADADLSRRVFDLPGEWGAAGTRRALAVPTTPTVTTAADQVTVEFALPKGAYATVLLREYMKAPPAAYA